MTPFIVADLADAAPDLADACPDPSHHPGDLPAVSPHTVTGTAGSLRAEYVCPCGREWEMRWTGGWPVLEPREAA